MCGQETPSTTPRVGARVDFFSPTGRGNLGNLLFLNPSSPSSRHATHVRFHQPPSSSSSQAPQALSDNDESILVSIHMTGDLTKPLCDSGLMQQFTLARSSSSSPGSATTTTKEEGVEMALGEALWLNVGHDGIIGRRVSMRKGEELLADGIVGFNSLPAVVGDGL
ncbi:hypothetical protein C8A00DRAFT_43987 [Chaetomidium leptoderma]|uniref:Uncharacterized protein n=1 Tax=Chaetomidium leptoderma TaxID=669021 RepID=A0AAN6ZV31_9PEZI|nr:hypothetical protein C8A00DRAFT_43987 [Chaetomidium leptoderma]